MVKLPPEDPNIVLLNLRSWMYSSRLYQEEFVRPIRLRELEEFAELAANHMKTNLLTTPAAVHNRCRQAAMDRIRQLFNVEFKLRCDVCGGAHYQDEITAPER